MSEVNLQSASQHPSLTKAEKVSSENTNLDAKMGGDGADVVQHSRPARPPPSGAPMYREPHGNNYNTAQQQGLFPVHTIVVQPTANQPKPRGNFTKAAAVAMNRRTPNPTTYFTQHRLKGPGPSTSNIGEALLMDEGPTVKQHLQEQQKQLKAKERMLEQSRQYAHTSMDSQNDHHNGGGSQIQGQVIRQDRNERQSQIVKTFTVQNSSGVPIIISNSRQIQSQQKRTPARPVAIESSGGTPQQPRLIAPRSRVNANQTSLSTSNRKLKVIVSPGVSTGFTTAAQKQQLAQSTYVVSTVPLAPTAPPPHSSAQITVQPLSVQGGARSIAQSSQQITVQRKLSYGEEMRRKQPQPVNRSKLDATQPSEYHVVTTVTPVTTPSMVPKPAPRQRVYSPPPTLDRMGELPLAILEGEEEIIAKEQTRKEEERRQREAVNAAFEIRVRELRDREQRILDEKERERRELELKRFEQRHQEQQRILDEKIEREMKLKREREADQRKRREEEKKQLQQQQQQQHKQLEEQKRQEETHSKKKEDPVPESTPVSSSLPAHTVTSLTLDEPDEPKEDPMLSQPIIPQNHLMLDSLGELNMDDLLPVGGDLTWTYQGAEHELYGMAGEQDYGLHTEGYFNEQSTNNDGYDPLMQFSGYGPDLSQHQSAAYHSQQQQVSHHHSTFLDNPLPIEDDLFTLPDKDDSLNNIDPLILDGFSDVLNDPNLMDAFPDFLDDPLECSKAASSKKSNSPDNVMSLIDWISNDDHDIGDDGDDLLGLRDERLESTASEYLNVCADVDFTSFDTLDVGPSVSGDPRPQSSIGKVIPPALPVSMFNDFSMAAQPDTLTIPPVVVTTPAQYQQETSPQSTQQQENAGRAKRKARSPIESAKVIEAPRSRERRRNEDRQARQRKAEMDAIEKEREAKQIAADCERVRQIMEMEERAIQAEKEAEALLKGPPPKKKNRSSASRNRSSATRTLASPVKSSAISTPTSGPTPLSRTPDIAVSQPVAMDFEQHPPLAIPGPIQAGFDPVPLPPTLPIPQLSHQTQHSAGCSTTSSITTPIVAAMTEIPPIQDYYPPVQPGAPVPYVDPQQYLQQQQFLAQQQAFSAENNLGYQEQQQIMQQMPDQYPPADYGMSYQGHSEMPYPSEEYSQWFDGPLEQFYQPDVLQELFGEPPGRPERTLSIDSGTVHYETETPKKKNRRSNSFTDGMEAAPEEEPIPGDINYTYDVYGNAYVLPPQNPEDVEEAIFNYLSQGGTTVNMDKELEAAILAGDAENLEKVLQNKESIEIMDSYSAVPLAVLYTMLENPHEVFSAEELEELKAVHGVDTTEQLKAEDTNIGIEVPRNILEGQDAELLEDYEWKRMLLQSFLHFIDEEKEEELAYMEEQVYAAEAATEMQYANRVDVIKKGLLSFLYNNAAILDEITRLAGKLMVTSEERKILARRLCHHQRNYIRRLQTASKRRSDAEKRRLENGGAPLNREKIQLMPPTPPPSMLGKNKQKSHKKKHSLTAFSPGMITKRQLSLDETVVKKKRGRPFTKNLPPMLLAALASRPVVATPSAKRKERSASIAVTPTQPAVPISIKRQSVTEERSRERGSRRSIHKEEDVVVHDGPKQTPEIVIIPPKPDLETEETKDVRTRTRRRKVEDVRKDDLMDEMEQEMEEVQQLKRKRRRVRKEKSEEIPERKNERKRMKGYVYEEEPIAQPDPEPEPETDPDAPIGLRKSARRSAQHLNFMDFSPRNTPDPDDNGRRRQSHPRTDSNTAYSPKGGDRNRSRQRRGKAKSESVPAEDSVEIESSPNTTINSVSDVVTPTSVGESENTTTSPDTPASDPPKEDETKEINGRRSLRTRRPTTRQILHEDGIDEEETPKKRRRIRTESSSTTTSTTSNNEKEKATPTRQSSRRRS